MRMLDYSKVDEFIKSNPTATYSVYAKVIPNAVSQSSFDRRRKILLSTNPRQSSPQSTIQLEKGKPMTVLEKCLEVVMSKPEGVSPDELSKVLSTSKASVFNMIFHLRKKHNIPLIGTVYKYSGTKTESTVNAVMPVHVPAVKLPSEKSNDVFVQLKSLQDNKLLTKVSQMSSTEQCDFFELTKKAITYGLSAVAMIQANDIVSELQQKMLHT